MDYYFEGDLPRANPAWETAKAGKEIIKPAHRDQEGLKIIIIKFYNLFSLKTYLCVDSFFSFYKTYFKVWGRFKISNAWRED